jgi:glycosyltransferase involved in cell wall biosynthesis
MELVSVVIPTLNAAKWIGDTLDSVFAQSYPCIEVIVVDDGSQDDTVPIVRRKLSGRLSDRWQVVEMPEKGAGPSAARNLGLKKASGSWIQFLDSDDFIAPAKIERQMAYCTGAPPDLAAVYSPWRRFYVERGEMVWEGPLARTDMDGREPIMCLVGGDRYLHGAGLARRSVLERIGGFDESLRFWECEEINIRIARAGRIACVPADEPFYLWRMHRERTYIGGHQARYQLAPVALSWMELMLKAAEYQPLSKLNLSDADRRTILDSCTIWARRLYARDRESFRRFLDLARGLDPLMVPTTPWYASAAARVVGYERAEAMIWAMGLPKTAARRALEEAGLRPKDSIFD